MKFEAIYLKILNCHINDAIKTKKMVLCRLANGGNTYNVLDLKKFCVKQCDPRVQEIGEIIYGLVHHQILTEYC